MENVRVGQLIDDDAERDAIHVALCPMVATERLLPNQPVGIVCKRSTMEFVYCGVQGARGTVGVVDPFLRAPVEKGQRCWLFLYPNTVTSLRHQWTHPQFQGSSGEIPHG